APRPTSIDDADDDMPLTTRTAGLPIPREGLPKSYRMRAERHYVDQIASHAVGSPVRLIPVAQFAAAATKLPGSIEPLVKSIAARGIGAPLVVRKPPGGNRVTAARRPLAAATAAGLTEVPRLFNQVGDAEAVAIAAADTVRCVATESAPAARTEAPAWAELL